MPMRGRCITCWAIGRQITQLPATDLTHWRWTGRRRVIDDGSCDNAPAAGRHADFAGRPATAGLGGCWHGARRYRGFNVDPGSLHAFPAALGERLAPLLRTQRSPPYRRIAQLLATRTLPSRNRRGRYASIAAMDPNTTVLRRYFLRTKPIACLVTNSSTPPYLAPKTTLRSGPPMRHSLPRWRRPTSARMAYRNDFRRINERSGCLKAIHQSKFQTATVLTHNASSAKSIGCRSPR